ncbi:MAG: hypothetical protein RBS99_09385 [Rhodospirillales bacterium]|jgi:hypothetical protein|nr:hypothetical protein [Rhodospirillales bacterium]
MRSPLEYGLSKAAYDYKETERQLSVKHTTLCGLVKSGRLRKTKVGRRTIFRAVDIADFLAESQLENAR